MKDLTSASDHATTRVDRSDHDSKRSGPRASPRALAAWQSLFANLPAEAPAEEAPAEEAPAAEAPAVEPAPSDAPDTAEPSAQEREADVGAAASLFVATDDGASRDDASGEAASAPSHVSSASQPEIDRPSSPFHVYEWVLHKLESNPATSFMQLQRLAERGNFAVSEGHYKRARREVDGRMPELSQSQLDALVEETLALVRRPLGEVQKLRAAACEIAEICDEVLASTSEPEIDLENFDFAVHVADSAIEEGDEAEERDEGPSEEPLEAGAAG